MRLKIPFYENKGDGNQCMQIAMKIVLKHFLGKDYSLEELDKLTGREQGKWTYTSQIVPVLYDLGLEVKLYSSESLEPYLEGEPFIRKHFGKSADKVIKMSNIPVMVNSVKKLLKYDIFEKKLLDFKEIEQHLAQGHIPLIVIDNNILIGKKDFYQGHFVAITGFDKYNVYYHESGPFQPTPNLKVKKQIFIDAWNSPGTDNDLVIVFGKR
ncbi:MAG: hypothetical protein ABIH72_03870 [archaeon]